MILMAAAVCSTISFEVVDTGGQVQHVDISAVDFLALSADQITLAVIRLDGGAGQLPLEGGSENQKSSWFLSSSAWTETKYPFPGGKFP